MFNIGGGEFMIIALIALIVLGPQRLPEAARKVGKVMGDLRRISSGFQNELKSAMDETKSTPTPARDVLAPEAATSTDAAPQGAPTQARPARRAPLKAAPTKKAVTQKTARPRSKGS